MNKLISRIVVLILVFYPLLCIAEPASNIEELFGSIETIELVRSPDSVFLSILENRDSAELDELTSKKRIVTQKLSMERLRQVSTIVGDEKTYKWPKIHEPGGRVVVLSVGCTPEFVASLEFNKGEHRVQIFLSFDCPCLATQGVGREPHYALLGPRKDEILDIVTSILPGELIYLRSKHPAGK